MIEIISCFETLGEACGRCGWLVHAYVLMGTATNFSTMLSRFERAGHNEKGYALRKRLKIIKI